jgi:hypothetical protein
MLTPELRSILNKYVKLGVVKGVELLLPQEFVIPFINDLAKIGVQINGCDLWRYVDRKEDITKIVELVGAGVLVQYANPLANSVKDYASVVKDYIHQRLPSDVDFISLIFEDGEIYNFIKNIEPLNRSAS